jgi:hypothetical protein
MLFGDALSGANYFFSDRRVKLTKQRRTAPGIV